MHVSNSTPPARRNAISAIDLVLTAVNRWLLILIFSVMALLVFAGVALRYLTNESLVWAEESSRYLMIWLAFLGMGPVLRIGGHAAIDSLTEAVPERIQRVLRLLSVALVAGFAVCLLYAGWAYVGRSWLQKTPVLGMPFALVAMSIPVGFALTLWHLAMIARGFVASGTFETSEELEPGEAVVS